MTVEHKGGRPLKFKTVKILQTKIDKYFKECEEKGKPLTITGLAVALNTTRETLLDYENYHKKYSDTIKKAKQICQRYVDEYLFTGKNTAGAIFNLLNNYGWKQKTEIDHTSKGEKIDSFNFVKPNDTDNNTNSKTV